jgi:hypothetical protein
VTGPRSGAPPGKRIGPAQDRPDRLEATGGGKSLTDTVTPAADFVGQLRCRRDAARRLPALCCGHRDPSDCQVRPAGPSTFALTADELRRHANSLAAAGWQLDEITAVLAVEMVAP